MKILVTDDLGKCGYRAIRDELTISQEECGKLKAVVRESKSNSNNTTIQKAQREFYSAMSEKYGKPVAGELLAKIWASSKAEKERQNG